MGAVATITPDSLHVQPGGEAACDIRVRNTGQVVDQFSFEALGDAASWATFEPSSVSLFPEAEGVARLVFRPPRGSETPAGPCPVGVRVRSKEDPRHPIVEELNLEVGRLADTFAELLPRTSRGSRRGVHHLAVDNRGNARLNATLSASDPDDQLGFTFDPPSVVADPGAAAFAKVVASPLNRFLRGQPVTHPFQVRVEPEGEAPLTVEATMLQEPVIPKWMPRALLGLVVVGWASVVLWALLLKPTVKTTAREAAQDVVSGPLAQTNAQLAALATKLGEQAGGGAAGAGTPTDGGDPAEDIRTASALDSPLGQPLDGRLEATSQSPTASFTVPDGQVFSLTDIFLQNPAGDAGLLKIQRGTVTLLAVRLENFRDLDYHFVAPIVFPGGEGLTLAVECTQPAPPATSCSPAAYYSGFIRKAA